MISDLKRVIDQVSREKGLDRNVLIQTLEEAVKAAARKKWGPNYDMEVTYNEEAGEIEVFEFKTVVEKVTNEHVEISMEEAHEVDPESELGDSLGIKMDTDEFGRIAAQSAKQVIMQRLREAERSNVYADFKDRKGEIVHGIVQRFDKGAIIVNLGRTEAELPVKEQIPKESYKQGDRIRAYICEVKQFSKGPQVILSRTHPALLSALFENEVPEICRRDCLGRAGGERTGEPFQDRRHLKGRRCGPRGGLRGNEGQPGPGGRSGTAGRKNRYCPLG